MKKYLKYVLAVAILVVACATFALADSSPVATVNGQPYSSLQDAFSAAAPGSKVVVVSDTTLSSLVTSPSGIFIEIPSGVTVNLDGVGFALANSRLDIYGNVIRTGSSGYGAVTVQGNSILNLYGGITTASSSTYGIYCSTNDPGLVNIYGGRVEGFQTAIGTTQSWGGQVRVYGGQFLPDLIPSSKIILANGANFVSGSENSAVSWGGLYEIGRIVSQGLMWIELFCASIVANKLLLIFVIFFMGFAGIGLIKRIIR